MALSTAVDPTTFLGSTVTTIVIITAHGEKKYVVHKHVLCDKSAYFATAYRTPMKEAAEDTFKIKDVPDTAMRSLITWLYTGKVYLEPGESPPLETSTVEPSGESTTGREENAPAGDNGRFDDGSDHDGSYSDGLPTRSDDYNAIDDGIDFEYDIEPWEYESDDEEEVLSLENEALDICKLSSWCFEGYNNASELDAYQLSVLIHECGLRPEQDWPYLESWKQRLEDVSTTETLIDNTDVDTYDRLIDLYILGDRFDIQDLRIKITDLVIAYQEEQHNLLGGQTLPTLQSVAKVCENLPSSCPLRVWLIHLYAWDWYAVIDHPEKAKLYDDLPRDFLLEVMSVMSQKSRWGWTDNHFPKYQDGCICHDYYFEDEEKRREMKGEAHPVNEGGIEQNKLRQ